MSREQAYAFRHPAPPTDGDDGFYAPEDRADVGPFAQAPGWGESPRQQVQRPQAPSYRNPFEDIVPWWDDPRPRRRSRRVDPDYFWGPRTIY